MLDLCLADSRVLYFWYVLESIHKFITELYGLQYLFVRGSNKKQRRGRIISNFTKGKTFYLLWQPSVLGGNLTMDAAFSLGKKIIYLDTELKAELTDLFWKWPGCSLFSWVRIEWWTLLWLTLFPHVRDSS